MDNRFRLPPHKPMFVISTLTQAQGWGIQQCNIPNTWTITDGEGETAMVIDTGHPRHTDIGDNAVEGKCFVPNESIYDVEGHQTHCVGIICAQNNDSGMVGVAPRAKCITAKALGNDGSGNFDWIVNALDYAAQIKPTVVSMSLGSPVGTTELHNAIKRLYDLNIPVVCAAGNDGNRGVDYPGNYPEVITVAAYDKNGNIAGFSGVGPGVDWAAPGVDIYSTFLNNQYCIMSGTSMATPFVTGIILLLIAKHKKQEKETGRNDCKTVDEIKQHLLKYTIQKNVLGRDNHWGYGIIDVEKLITSTETETISASSFNPIPISSPKKSWWQSFREGWKRFWTWN